MTVKILTESIIIPRTKDFYLELESGASAADAVLKMENQGRTGNLTAKEVLDTHILIRNSKHIKPEELLEDGDSLMIIKTLLGG